MRTSVLVAIPLTLFQLAVHPPGVAIDAPTLANNVLASYAVYGADRLPAATPRFAPARVATTACAALSCAYYASDPHTAWLAPCVLLLHARYADLKPRFAPAKPFVVSAFWTLAVYYAPAWRAGVPILHDVLVPAFVFLHLASLSHTADVVDVEEDRTASLRTPAVVMDDPAAYALGLGLAASYLHELSPLAFAPYDAVSLAVVGALAYDAPLASTLASAAVVAAYFDTHALEVCTGALRATESVHSVAIQQGLHAVERALALPEPLRKHAVEALLATVRAGDVAGGALLSLYEAAVRHHL